MNKYQDEYSRWHDRTPATSNNSWLYSAVSKYRQPNTLDNDLLNACFRKCVTSEYNLNRSPDKSKPPMSIDEIYGLVSIGFLDANYLELAKWNFCNIEGYEYTRPTLRSFRTLYTIRNCHRNYFWQNGLTETYSLAFMVMPWFKYTIKKLSSVRPSIFETIMFYTNAISVICGKDRSTRQLLWLQLKDLKSKFLIKLLPTNKVMSDYYEDGHPFLELKDK